MQGVARETFFLNVGPSHPATHGGLRLKLELEEDKIVGCEPIVGYLHRGMEKIAECATYTQFIPYTDHLDYLAPLHNNMAYALAVEKLAGIQVPPRCEAIRVILCELARISSHLFCIGSCAMDTGAKTGAIYCSTEREKLYSLFEALSGARVATSYARIGGIARDLPDGWTTGVLHFFEELLLALKDIDGLLTRNKIWMDRTVGVGEISCETALAYGLTGPNLRASGVASDLRCDRPYSGYQRYHFSVPMGQRGDCYDRYRVRLEEVHESISIVRQAIESLPDGPWYVTDAPQVFLPQKAKILTTMEGLIQDFVLTTQGPQIPPGMVYFEAENPKGALGFFIISKGGGVPFRLKIRSPSFCNLSVLPKILPGHPLSDLAVILGSLDIGVGECDR